MSLSVLALGLKYDDEVFQGSSQGHSFIEFRSFFRGRYDSFIFDLNIEENFYPQ
jgi:hypothetical protein